MELLCRIISRILASYLISVGILFLKKICFQNSFLKDWEIIRDIYPILGASYVKLERNQAI